jgi:hypothetical protein
MKAHTCNTKRSQKAFEPRTHKLEKSHTQYGSSHTQSRNVTHKKVELSSWGVRQISMLIYLGRHILHTFPHFVYGGRIECCDFPRFNYKALF